MSNNSSFSFDSGDDLVSLYLTAAEIANTSGFVLLLVLEVIVAVLSLIPNCLLLYVLFCTSIFPLNLRLLLGHLSLNLIWYAIAVGVKAAIILPTVSSANPDRSRELVVKAFMCKAGELANTIPLQNVVYTSLALCLERMYSTVFYKLYEETQHSKPYLALVFVPIVWAVTLGNQLSGLLRIAPDREMPICESLLSTTPSSAMLTLALSLSSEALCVILILIVYLWNNIKLRNMTINRAQQTLGARFQISQNVQLNSMLLPSLIVQAICYLPNYVFLFFVIFGLDETRFRVPLRVLLIHCNYVWKVFYALAHPVAAFASKAKLIDHLKKHSSWIRSCNKNVVRRIKPRNGQQQSSNNNIAAATRRANKPEDAHAHFEVLAQIWASHAIRLASDRGLKV